MNSWCESCARKSQCYTADIKPKCYVPITNTDRMESTFIDKVIEAYSKGFTDVADAIKDLKDKPQTCKNCQFDSRYGIESICNECSRHYSDCYASKNDSQVDGYMTAEQTADYHKMLDNAEHKVYGNIFEDSTKDIAKDNDSCNDNKLTLEEALMLSLDMALIECKKRHGGCENCYAECAWREPQNIEE